MHALILLLSLVAPHPEPPPPRPIGSTRPELGGLCFFGGSVIGSDLGSWSGCEWVFGDGNRVEVGSHDAIYRWSQFETETYLLAFFAGTAFGVRQEYYLGHGFVVALDLGWGANSARVIWYPADFMSYSFGIDLLRGKLRWDWWSVSSAL